MILLLLIIINVLMFLPLLLYTASRKYFLLLFSQTIGFVKNVLGYLNSIFGKIRVGKTTLMSGLSHIFQIIIINNNDEIMKNIRKIFYFVDFNELESIVIKLIIDEHIHDLDYITNFLIDNYNFDPDHLYFDFLNYTPVRKLVFEYVEAFYVINIRQQYVYSKTNFYSHITNKSNLRYDLQWSKIHEALENCNYAIYDNFIELIDESTDDLAAANWRDDPRDESGSVEYLRKFANMHREKNYRITAKQDSSDEVSRYRRLNNSNIEIYEKVDVIGNFKITNFIINKFIDLINLIYKIKFYLIALIFKGLIDYDDRNNYIEMRFKGKLLGKRIQDKLFFLQKFLFAQAYCRFKTKVYFDEQDVGKENTENKYYYEKYNFIIPLKYCFGCFDTYQFSYIQNNLIKNSKIHLEDLEESLMFVNPNKKFVY